MRISVAVFGLVLLLIAFGQGQGPRAGEDKPKPAEAVKEQSVVEYDSKTHGAVQVKSVEAKPTDYFDVLKDGKRAFPGNPKILNNSVELAPGAYVVVVNRTQRQVTIEAGKKTVLWTGELLVEGKPTSAFWYPMQGKERRLSGNPPLLNKSRALFPGTYTVFVHVGVGMDDKNLGNAEVTAGQKKVLKY